MIKQEEEHYCYQDNTQNDSKTHWKLVKIHERK